MPSEHADDQLSLGADFLTNFTSRQMLSHLCLYGNISIAPLPAPFAEETMAGFFEYLRSATTNSLFMIGTVIQGPTACQVSFEDLPHLQTFALDIFVTNLFRPFSAADLFMMFARWPNLNHLHASGVDQVAIDFSSLVEIARQLPLLKDLRMETNCRSMPTTNDISILQHNLKTLTLSLLYLDNCMTLAGFIDRVFPELVALSVFDYGAFRKPGDGREVQEMYQGLQSARMDQRKRDQFSISSTSH